MPPWEVKSVLAPGVKQHASSSVQGGCQSKVIFDTRGLMSEMPTSLNCVHKFTDSIKYVQVPRTSNHRFALPPL